MRFRAQTEPGWEPACEISSRRRAAEIKATFLFLSGHDHARALHVSAFLFW